MNDERSIPSGQPDGELVLLSQLLGQLGCPADKALEMAEQLDRRASQLAETTGRAKGDALQHLIGLMRRGWAAQANGVSSETP